MTELTTLIEQFKQQGHKMTPQRRAILRVLEVPGTHLTAEQIYERVRETMPDLSLATVYNALRELVSAEVLRELELGLGKRYYEMAGLQHVHLLCLNCNNVHDLLVDWDHLGPLLASGNGFTPLSYEIVVHGYCANCGSPDIQKDN